MGCPMYRSSGMSGHQPGAMWGGRSHGEMPMPLVPAPMAMASAMCAFMFGIMMGVMMGKKSAMMHGKGGYGYGHKPPWMMQGMGGHHHHGYGPACGCGEPEKAGSAEE